MTSRSRRGFNTLLLGAPCLLSTGTAFAQAQRRPLLIENTTSLYQRVIMRPGARLAERPDPAAPNIPTPGFGVFYAFARQGVDQQVWVEVGPSLNGPPVGWVKAAQTVDWKQTMVVAFTNPAGRERAMFFKSGEVPRRLWLDLQSGASEAASLRSAAAEGADDPVIALEPETFVDITRQFYLLPILSAEAIENERTNRARVLEVASAPVITQSPNTADVDALKNFKGALVFVVDTTSSMGPYIERTRLALKQVIDRIGRTEVRDNFRFGMVAFRDDMGGDQRLEYVTRMIALPDLQETPDALLGRLTQAREAAASNESFSEDSLAGVKMALDEVQWDKFGGRYIVLITDASARESNDPRSQTRLGPQQIRQLAQAENKLVQLLAIHLKTPAGRSDHDKGEEQYRALTRIGNAGEELYFPIEQGNLDEFSQTVETVTNSVLRDVARIVGRPIGNLPPPSTPNQQRISEQIEVASTAMRLAYLGRTRQESAPDLVRSFVLDEDIDPTDPQPGKRPLRVRVLLTRNQLSDLALTVRTIVDAVRGSRITPDAFFGRVRGAIASATRDPRRMAEFQQLQGAFGEYLDGLPYKSAVMEITPQSWQLKTPAERTQILNGLDEKVRLYAEYNRQSGLWVSFDGGRDPGEAMFPVPIDDLP
jgi:serine/threonine-protein kinase PpkA